MKDEEVFWYRSLDSITYIKSIKKQEVCFTCFFKLRLLIFKIEVFSYKGEIKEFKKKFNYRNIWMKSLALI